MQKEVTIPMNAYLNANGCLVLIKTFCDKDKILKILETALDKRQITIQIAFRNIKKVRELVELLKARQ